MPEKKQGKQETNELAGGNGWGGGFSVDKVLQMFNLEKIDVSKRTEISDFIAGLNLKEGLKLENDPQVLGLIAEKLKNLGFEVADINRETLVVESQVDLALADINELITSGKEVTTSYPSNVGIYHWKVEADSGERVYKRTSVGSFTAGVESLLMKYDDLGGSALGTLFSKPIRVKANEEQVRLNVRRLGINEFNVEEGIKEDVSDIQSGFMLDDLLRLRDKHPFLQKFDRLEAISAAAKTINDVYSGHEGGVGELLANDFVMKVKDGKIIGCRLTIPDSVYHVDVPDLTQKAYDLADFCFSVASAGLQTGGREKAEEFVTGVLDECKDKQLRQKLFDLVKSGVPNFTMHSKTRLGFDRVEKAKDEFIRVRELVAEKLSADFASI